MRAPCDIITPPIKRLAAPQAPRDKRQQARPHRRCLTLGGKGYVVQEAAWRRLGEEVGGWEDTAEAMFNLQRVLIFATYLARARILQPDVDQDRLQRLAILVKRTAMT